MWRPARPEKAEISLTMRVAFETLLDFRRWLEPIVAMKVKAAGVDVPLSAIFGIVVDVTHASCMLDNTKGITRHESDDKPLSL